MHGNSVLLTHDGYGHPSSKDPSQCIETRADAVLVPSMPVETSADYDPLLGPPQFYEWYTIGQRRFRRPAGPATRCRPYVPIAEVPREVTVETANPQGQLVFANLFVWNYPTTS